MRSNEFMTSGYKLVHHALNTREAKRLLKYLAIMDANSLLNGNTDGKSAHTIYAIPALEALLIDLKEDIEEIVGIKLFPSFSFLWNYKKGHVVPRHFDRDSVDISCSITLRSSSDLVWPIYLLDEKNSDKAIEIDLKENDMLILDGKRLLHWRNSCPYDNRLQIILCYSKQENYKFDRRKKLGADPITEITTCQFNRGIKIEDDYIIKIKNEITQY